MKRLFGRSRIFLVDLFLRCGESEGISKLKAVYEACQSVAKSLPQSGGHKNMLITRTSCTVTIFISNDKQIPPIQVSCADQLRDARHSRPISVHPSIKRDEPLQPTVVLQVVENVTELLRQCDVDCAAVAFEPATGKTYMYPRAKRAFESGCIVLDSRFNSPTYAERLWKYANRGFAVAVPGLDMHLVSPNIAKGNYVFMQDKNILLMIDKMGRFGSNQTNVQFDVRRSRLGYVRCDEASRVDGLMKLLVMDRCISNGNVRTVSLPTSREREKSRIRTAELAVNTDSALLLHTGVPRKYHLFWGAALPNNEDDFSEMDDEYFDAEVTEDVSGYAWTPLARAYDLFAHLLEMQLLEEDPSQSGIVARLSGRMQQQNGEIAASMCRRHYDRMFSMKRCPVGFAWDLRNANVDGFDSLKTIFDAGAIPSMSSSAGLADNMFEQKYGFPRLLRFKPATLRRPTKIDWFLNMY